MHFPAWDQDPTKTPEERGCLRLRYMFMQVMLQRRCSVSVREFARMVGVTHDNLQYAFRQGKCSPRLAIKIEKAVGRDVLPHEFLTDPVAYTTTEATHA